MFYLIGIIISFFLTLLLAGKRNKSEADHILALWLLFTGFHLTMFYLFISGNYHQFPYLLGTELPLPLIHGPFLYLYVVALTEQRPKWRVALLHFLPVLLAYLIMIPFLCLPVERKIWVYDHEGRGYELIKTALFIALIASGICYVWLSLKRLNTHKKNIEQQFSYTDKINLNWLRYLIYGTSTIWLVIISGLPDEVIYAAVVLYVVFIGYFGIRQVGVFTYQQVAMDEPGGGEPTGPLSEHGRIFEGKEDENPELQDPEPGVSKTKYWKSGLTDDVARKIHEDLNALMETQKLFKDPELSLLGLSRRLDVHPNNLSQVINSIEKMNFYDYINARRIDEFKRIIHLPENQKFTLLSLAYECGFNSKTTFNRNFKKITGFAPSEYLKQINLRLEE